MRVSVSAFLARHTPSAAVMLFLSFCVTLCISLGASGQSAEQIRRSGAYVWAEASTDAEAQEGLLAKLAEKEAFTCPIENRLSVIRSFSAELRKLSFSQNTGSAVIRFIALKDIDKIFRPRAKKAAELRASAEKSTSPDLSLTYFSWARSCLMSLPRQYQNGLEEVEEKIRILSGANASVRFPSALNFLSDEIARIDNALGLSGPGAPRSSAFSTRAASTKEAPPEVSPGSSSKDAVSSGSLSKPAVSRITSSKDAASIGSSSEPAVPPGSSSKDAVSLESSSKDAVFPGSSSKAALDREQSLSRRQTSEKQELDVKVEDTYSLSARDAGKKGRNTEALAQIRSGVSAGARAERTSSTLMLAGEAAYWRNVARGELTDFDTHCCGGRETEDSGARKTDSHARSFQVAYTAMPGPRLAQGPMLAWKGRGLGGYLSYRSSWNTVTYTSSLRLEGGPDTFYSTGSTDFTCALATAGAVVSVIPGWLDIYAGAGAGLRNVYWERYSPQISNSWVRVEDHSAHGFSLEGGILISLPLSLPGSRSAFSSRAAFSSRSDSSPPGSPSEHTSYVLPEPSSSLFI